MSNIMPLLSKLFPIPAVPLPVIVPGKFSCPTGLNVEITEFPLFSSGHNRVYARICIGGSKHCMFGCDKSAALVLSKFFTQLHEILPPVHGEHFSHGPKHTD